jgi:hypothetical protein
VVAAAIVKGTTGTKTTSVSPARSIEAPAFARGVFFAGTGYIHFQRAALKFLAFRVVHCFLRFFTCRERHKGKASGAVGEAISHNFYFLNGAKLGEVLPHIFFRGTPCEVADE